MIASLLRLMPWYYRWAAVLALAAALLGYGYTRGLEAGQRRVEALQAQQAAQMAKAQAAAAAAVIHQQQITGVVSDAYEKELDAVHGYWAGRLRQQSGPGMPALPSAPSRPDEIPPDALPIAEQCASTTAQLTALQDWVRQQEAAQH